MSLLSFASCRVLGLQLRLRELAMAALTELKQHLAVNDDAMITPSNIPSVVMALGHLYRSPADGKKDAALALNESLVTAKAAFERTSCCCRSSMLSA